MASLLWKRPDGSRVEFPLGERAVLGRDPGADCRVGGHGVSRRHAVVERREGKYRLRDLGSTNGTLLNGVPVEAEAELHPGDRIQIGLEVLEFQDGGTQEPTRSALPTEALTRAEHYQSVLTGKASPSAPGLPEVLPRRLGRFQLVEKLGRGGMGEVYRAVDLRSRRQVALKLIRSDIGRREAFLRFFHNREAVLAREIDHPNVIRVLEHGIEGDRHYLAMEYVEGENLQRAMRRRKLKPAEVLEILRQTACGLAAAHRRGVVHSDVKPANILLADGALGSEGGEPEEPAGDDVSLEILEFEAEEGGRETASARAEGVRADVVPPRSPAPSAGTETSGAGSSNVKLDPGLLAEIRRRIRPSLKEILEDPPFFPRPAEMRYLEHYFERLQDGRGFFVLVEGEPGSGKDRLISEFLLKEAERPRSDVSPPPRFVNLDCSRIEGLPLLWRELCPGKPLPGRTQRELVAALEKVITESSEPLVLRVLSLGNATPLACQFLWRSVSQMERRPLLVIAGLQPQELAENNALKALIESSQAALRELYLRPLSEYQIQRYIEDLYGPPLDAGELARDLYRLSGGNPARILDLLESFVERGVLAVDSESGELTYRPRRKELELEEGKNLYEKYRSYGRTEQRVLELTGFIGPRFFFDTLGRLLDIDETSLFFIVRHLLNDGFFVEESRTWYRFTNAAFQRYMAERVPPPERAHLHRRLSRMLMAVPVPESAELYQLRAIHFAGCREYAKAVQCLLEGAHLARNDYNLDLARELYQEILRIYHLLAARPSERRRVNEVLRDWFRRDGNWYAILGALAASEERARVKIADFGISFRAGDEQRGYRVGKRPLLGTPRYLAPERFKGEPGGPRSDIFSLGVIAYELIAGEPPFPGLKGADVMRAYAEQPIRVPLEALEGYPAGTERLLEGMLAPDPARRWDAERVVREIVKLQFDLELPGKRSA